MTRKNNIKALTLATGTALVLGLASTSAFADNTNPFGMNELSQGYQVAMEEGKCGGSKTKSTEGKCGEGKCGASKTKSSEGKCGEGKCGASKTKTTEGKCGGSKTKSAEGKCGEGKCGGSK